MDHKVNCSIRKILDKAVPEYQLTLSDKIMHSGHQLPKPDVHRVRPIGKNEDPIDLAHWKSIPEDVKESEV